MLALAHRTGWMERCMEGCNSVALGMRSLPLSSLHAGLVLPRNLRRSARSVLPLASHIDLSIGIVCPLAIRTPDAVVPSGNRIQRSRDSFQSPSVLIDGRSTYHAL
ncbi:hypothetical protein T10_4892 [Trichinella papuae]|uniref:Uncharacterized protein n=1 Tax=Trichinella papuae TaxID=268474 RepID=A0A0V1M158_9BILA|nr:hypothetical protein T10_4892 [Trichinella papuae]